MGWTTWLGYDGLELVAEDNGQNAYSRRYVFGPGIDEPLVWYEGSGTTDRRFLHADERGSIVAVSDSSGAMTAINTYDEYGQPSANNAGRWAYTGQSWLISVGLASGKELGLYHYKARAYRPGIGRFLQPDPIGYDDSPNLYAYVGNDPINFIDPLGARLCRRTVQNLPSGKNASVLWSIRRFRRHGELYLRLYRL